MLHAVSLLRTFLYNYISDMYNKTNLQRSYQRNCHKFQSNIKHFRILRASFNQLNHHRQTSQSGVTGHSTRLICAYKDHSLLRTQFTMNTFSFFQTVRRNCRRFSRPTKSQLKVKMWCNCQYSSHT